MVGWMCCSATLYRGTMLYNAEVAQLVEHFPEEEGVAGSSPALGTRMVGLVGMLVLLEKLDKRNTRESNEGSRVGLV